MNREQSRRECTDLVASIEVPDPFDLAEFCTLLGHRIERPIVLLSHAMTAGGLCGMWMRTDKANYVFYEQDTSPLHQQHIIFHEVGHILRSHAVGKELIRHFSRAAAPSLKVSDSFRVLTRDSDYEDDEFEAELIATLMMRRIGRQSAHAVPRATDPAAEELVARIADSLAGGAR